MRLHSFNWIQPMQLLFTLAFRLFRPVELMKPKPLNETRKKNGSEYHVLALQGKRVLLYELWWRGLSSMMMSFAHCMSSITEDVEQGTFLEKP